MTIRLRKQNHAIVKCYNELIWNVRSVLSIIYTQVYKVRAYVTTGKMLLLNKYIMDKNEFIVKDVAKQKIIKARCKYEQMTVLELRCYMKSVGFTGIQDSTTRSEMYTTLKKDKKSVHLFVEFPLGMLSHNFRKEKREEAKKEYARRLKLFKSV